MDFFDVIANRASYRKAFTGEPVPRDDLIRIVEAGIRAPSGYNGQSTSFVIVTEPDLLARIREIAGDRPVLATAGAVVAVVMDPGATREREHLFGVEDYAAATENMLLAITALGYASVWVDGALRSNRVAELVGELLGVPADREVRVILPIGRPAEPVTPAGRKPFAERARFEHWKAD